MRQSVHSIACIPQGSILGPVLWNVMYDEVLKLKCPVRVKIVEFANDITLEVYGESNEEVELIATHSIGVVEDWMRSRKPELALPKEEVIIVNNRKSEQHPTIHVGDCFITPIFTTHGGDDQRQASFESHVDYVCKRGFHGYFGTVSYDVQ